jgi:glucose/arabinose dehydrogenase
MRNYSILIILLFTSLLYSQELELEIFESGFTQPVAIENAGDSRLFIVEQTGYIQVIDGSIYNFLDIDARVRSGGERGLLGLAFHPDFLTNGLFYVNYTQASGATRISKFNVMESNALIGDPNSEEILLEISQPFSNHNGGDINFGPDGYLYIATGDGGSGGDPDDYGQNNQSLLGKMLRIDVDAGNPYAIPTNNPFVNDPSTLNEIWATGLRNPWRFNFDNETGDMWIGDVGQNEREEINYQAANSPGGEDYGWRCYEGNLAFNTDNCADSSSFQFPIFDYIHDGATGGFSVTGGGVYRGSDYPNFIGKYICADFATGNFWSIELTDNPNNSVELLGNQDISPSTFGFDQNGEMYVAGYGGAIYKVTDALALPLEIVEWSLHQNNNDVLLKWNTAFESAIDHYIIQYSLNGLNFEDLKKIELKPNSVRGNDYSFVHRNLSPATYYYKIKQVNKDGTDDFTKVLNTSIGKDQKALILSPNPFTNQVEISQIDEAISSIKVQVLDRNQRAIRNGVFQNINGTIKIDRLVSNLSKGFYLVRLEGIGLNEVMPMIKL